MAPAYRRQPSTWPKGWLISLRLLQFISAIIVFAVMGFFAYHLRKEEYPVPYEFIALYLIAGVTIINVVLSLFLLCCRFLRPLFVIIVDFLICLVWAASFGMLGRAMGKTIIETCTESNYGKYLAVCHMYKMVFAFTFVGWILHLGTSLLAYSVRKKANSHAYEKAVNPAVNLMNTKHTAYKPMDTGPPAYGSSAPAVYSPETAHGVKMGHSGGATTYA